MGFGYERVTDLMVGLTCGWRTTYRWVAETCSAGMQCGQRVHTSPTPPWRTRSQGGLRATVNNELSIKNA